MAEQLAAWPGMVGALARRYTDAGGRCYSPVMALSVWTLARALDPTGRGRVHLGELRAAGLELWTRASFYRHMRDAGALGLVHTITRKRDGAAMVACTGVRRVAELLELPDVGARRVSIPFRALASAKSFKRALWAAYHAGRSANTGAPITRGTLRGLTGLPESTQRAYECTTPNGAGGRATLATPNAVVLAAPTTPAGLAGALAAAREFIHGGCYVHRGQVLRPIGNTYTSSLTAGSRSRARKLNRLLSYRPGVILPPGSHKRLFYADPAKAERAARAGRAVDVPLANTGQVAAGVVLWAPVWDSWSLAHVAGV